MKKTWKTLLKNDVKAWGEYYKLEKVKFLNLFIQYPEFRVLVKMRLKYGERANSSFILKILRILVAISCRGHNCFIYTESHVIGERLILHHAFATMISAEKIGDNCHIYQQVTIGHGGGQVYQQLVIMLQYMRELKSLVKLQLAMMWLLGQMLLLQKTYRHILWWLEFLQKSLRLVMI